MSDRRLMDMDAQIKNLEEKIIALKQLRHDRERMLHDPSYLRIRGLYEKIAHCITELDKLGESTHGPLDEYDRQLSIEITGKTFSYYGGDITEN